MTQNELKNIVHYNKETGKFTWLNCNRSTYNNTELKGSDDKDGYLTVKINQVRYRLHRLAWLYVYGEFPKHQLDHINHIKYDNRIDNLRNATNQQNQWHKPASKRNTTGAKGVIKRGNSFTAQMTINGKKKYLGSYKTVDEAKNAYINMAKQLHGEYVYE